MTLTFERKLLRVMRLTSIILLTCCIHIAAKTSSQTVTYKGTNEPLEKIFKVVENQTGYFFIYNPALVEHAKPVTIDAEEMPLESFLKNILVSQQLEYEFNDQTVIIKRKPLSAELKSPPPPIDIRGRVVDEQGNPVVGASVVVKGTNQGTTTDDDGSFKLTNVEDHAILVISGSNIEKLEMPVNGRTVFSLSVKVKVTSLQDVVINKGYYSTSQRFNTGNVTRVDGEELRKQPVTDLMQALQAKVPGLYIQQYAGVPGANSTFHIRGINSIPSSSKQPTLNDPLFIVDGVPFSSQTTSPTFFGNILGAPSATSQIGYADLNSGIGISPFSTIDLSNIESVEVLKDADATAIYGARGANGVILITTKKGKAGPTRVNVNITGGVATPASKVDLLNTQQYQAMRREAFKNDGLQPGSRDYDINGAWDTTRYTNWQKVLIGRTATFYNANLRLSGGNANTNFSIAGTYNNQGTSMPGNYSGRTISINSSISHISSNKRFRAQFGSFYSTYNSNLPGQDLSNYIYLAPNAPAVYDKNGDLNWQMIGGINSWDNPMAYTKTVVNQIDEYLNGNLLLSYQLVKGLELKTNMGYGKSHSDYHALYPSTNYPPPYNTDPSFRTSLFSNSDLKTWIIEPQLNYQTSLSKGKLDFLLGSTFQQSGSNSQGFTTGGYASDALLANPAAASLVGLAGYTTRAYYYNSIYGRLGYNWDGKYLLNLTARRDGSSRFGPGRQFSNFGAIGAGWIFTEEKWMQNALPLISFGKLSGSYGVTGSDAAVDYGFMSTYSIYTPTYLGVTGLRPSRHANPFYSWERNKKVGIDLTLGLLKDRVNVIISWYRNRSDNQLVAYILPSLTGFASVQANLPATVQNTGYEFALNTININSRDFTWVSSANLSIPKNKLAAFPNIETSAYRYSLSVGQPLTTRFVSHYIGINPESGIYQFVSNDGTGFPHTPDDQIWSKALTQSLFGGLQNNVRYKEFGIDFTFQFVKQIKPNYLASLAAPPGSYNQNIPTLFLDPWQKSGDMVSIQKFTTGQEPYVNNAHQQMASSDGIYSDGSFIRLKNVALSWQLPKGWQKKMHLQGASFSINGQNLLTLTQFKGLDPETGSFIPPLKTITGSIHLTL